MCRAIFFGLLLTAPAVSFAAANVPLQWSPDGRWVAYTVALPASRPIPPPGWLFDTSRVVRAVDNNDKPRIFRIYATDAETYEAVLLAESRSPMTSPEWGPDGHSLAFGRIRSEGQDAPRFEIVIQNGLRQERVLLSEKLVGKEVVSRKLASLNLAWSPDGRYLAVPSLSTPDRLTVVRADNGMTLKTLDQAVWPAWSPDSSKLAYIRPGKSASLYLMDASFGAPRHLMDLGQTFQPPVWSRDGRSVLAVGRRMLVRGPAPTPQLVLQRIQVDSGEIEAVAPLALDPMPGDKSLRGLSFTIDRDDDLFSSLDADGQPAAIVWFRPRNQETVNRFSPLDIGVRVGSLTVAPVGKTLAFRLGGQEAGATAAFWGLNSARLTALVPDDSARVEWVSLLIASARGLLQFSLPNALVDGKPVGRPTILPVAGEIPPHIEVLTRLRRLGRLGRPLCERPSDAPPAEPELDVFLAEARLFFDVLQENYPSALTSLDELQGRMTSPEHQLRLLTLRAQIFVGQGDLDRAKDTIRYLRSLENQVPSRVEITPAGVSLVPDHTSSHGWARYLALRLENNAKAEALAKSRDAETLGRRNEFAPFPRAPFVQLPDMPIAPADRDGVVLDPPPGQGFDPDVRVQFRRQVNRRFMPPPQAPAPPRPIPPR